MSDDNRPNLFVLDGRSIQVTYSLTGILGRPVLHYRDDHLSEDFGGDEILVEETAVGRLVTVRLRVVEHVSTVLFTLVVPDVRLPGQVPVPLRTVGIVAVRRREANSGGHPQLDTYRFERLRGTASLIMSVAAEKADSPSRR